MAANSSRVRAQYDAATECVLRAPGSASVVATGLSTALSLKELDQAYWHGGEIPYGKIVIAFVVEAIDLDAVLPIQVDALVDDVVGMNDSPAVVGGIQVSTVGYYEIVVDAKSIPGIDSDSSGTDKWLAVRVTLDTTDEAQTISYAAWIAKGAKP